MSLGKNIKNPTFWVNVFKVGFPFFVIVTIFSLLFNTGGAIFSGDWNAVYEYHFANNRWIRFLLQKTVISTMYGMYMSNKNMK